MNQLHDDGDFPSQECSFLYSGHEFRIQLMNAQMSICTIDLHMAFWPSPNKVLEFIIWEWTWKVFPIHLMCTELFYAIIPACFLTFCCSAIPTSPYIFNVFTLVIYAVHVYVGRAVDSVLPPTSCEAISQVWGQSTSCCYSPLDKPVNNPSPPSTPMDTQEPSYISVVK